jgi:hypothetical protein
MNYDLNDLPSDPCDSSKLYSLEKKELKSKNNVHLIN